MVINIDTDKLLAPKTLKPFLGIAKFVGLCLATTFGVHQWQHGNIYTAVAVLAASSGYGFRKLAKALNDAPTDGGGY